MKRILIIILVLFLAVVLSRAGDYKLKESEDIVKSLKFTGPGKHKALTIDNIFGFIHVQGYDGREVKLAAHKTIKAESGEKIEKAKKEVKLDISEEGDAIKIVVNGPFRDEKGSICWPRDLGYVIQYDFELKVPHRTELSLKTINDGFIKVQDVEGECKIGNVNGEIEVHKLVGDFKVSTVNGKVVMTDISGSGKAHTVNGEVKVLFSKNPTSNCSFKTINGKLEIFFLPGLAADFQLKTFHGEIYSDFPAEYLPTAPGKGERKGGKFVYKSSHFSGIRIGTGGPEIRLETLSGNILIKEK